MIIIEDKGNGILKNEEVFTCVSGTRDRELLLSLHSERMEVRWGCMSATN